MSDKDGKFYVFEKKEEPKPKKAVLALFLAITLLWVAGMACLFARLTDLGLMLWGVSFFAGLIVYFVQRHNASMREFQETEMAAEAKPMDDAAKDEEKTAESK